MKEVMKGQSAIDLNVAIWLTRVIIIVSENDVIDQFPVGSIDKQFPIVAASSDGGMIVDVWKLSCVGVFKKSSYWRLARYTTLSIAKTDIPRILVY